MENRSSNMIKHKSKKVSKQIKRDRKDVENLEVSNGSSKEEEVKVKNDKKKPKKDISTEKTKLRKNKSTDEDKLKALKVGDLVEGVVIQKDNEKFTLSVDGSEIKLFLYFNHLSDSVGEHVQNLVNSYKVGDTFNDLLVLAKPSKKSVPVTMKNLLVTTHKLNLVEHLPSKHSDCTLGEIVIGYVTAIEANCVKVNFLDGLTAQVSIESLSDKDIDSPSNYFQIFQTVVALVKSVDVNDGIQVSLKESEVLTHVQPNHPLFDLIHSSLTTSYFLESSKYSHWGSNPNLPGQLVTARVTSKLDKEWKLKVGKSDAVINVNQLSNLKVEKGATVECCMLDFVPDNGDLILSAKKELLSMSKTGKLSKSVPVVSDNIFSQLEALLNNSEAVSACIEYIHANFLVASLPKYNHAIVYIPLITFNFRKSNDIRFEVNKVVKVYLTHLKRGSSRILARLDKNSLLIEKTAPEHAQSNSKLQVGSIVLGSPINVCKHTMKLRLNLSEHGTEAIAYFTDFYDNYADITNPRDPFGEMENMRAQKFKVTRVVMNANSSKESQSVSGKKPRLYVTCKPSLLNSTDLADLHKSLRPKLQIGEVIVGFITEVNKEGLAVKLSSHKLGYVSPLDISGDLKIVNHFTTLFKPGMAMECVVNGFSKKGVKLSIIDAPIELDNQHSSYPAPNRQLSDYLVGTQTVARIDKTKFDKKLNLHVELPTPYAEGESTLFKGVLHRLEAVDDFLDLPELYPSQIVSATVVQIDHDNTIRLSLRSKDANLTDLVLESFQDVELGATVKGIIHKVNKPKIEVVFGPKLEVTVEVDPTSKDDTDRVHRLKLGSVASFQVLATDPPRLKLIKVLPYHQVSVTSFNPAKVVLARIQEVTKAGLKLEDISDKKVMFCARKQIPKMIKDLSLHFVLNKEVTVQLIGSKDPESNQQVTLLPKQLLLGDYRPGDSQDSEDDISEGEQVNHETDDEVVGDEDDEQSHGEDRVEEEETLTSKYDLPVQPPPLDTAQDALQLSDSEDEVDNHKPKTLSTTPPQPEPKVKASRRLPKDITAELDTTAPKTTTDFERLLLTSPNSSYLWIGYMAHHLQLREVELARSVANKALQTINFNQEQERFNIHVARMNLELKFAGLECLLNYYDKAKFEVNQPKHIGLRLADILKLNQHSVKAEETLLQMCKKFSTSCKVWVALGQFYLDMDTPYAQQFKQTLPKAIQSLPKRKHLKLTLKFASLEFKANNLERARTLFEGILATYPKRTDLIHHYVDLEIKYGAGKVGDLERIRRIFERTLNNHGIKLKSNQVKGLFKKYLAFEDTYGDEIRKDHVKGLAVEFIRNLNGV